jgi:hypothetical protein
MAATTPDVPQLHAIERVQLAELRAHPRNYRRHPERQLAHLAQSLREHGVYRNVVVANDGTILAGHGVVEAAADVGLSEIDVVRIPFAPDHPKARKLLAADNELARLADDDAHALAHLLEEIRDDDVDGLLGTGYSDDDLTILLASLDELPPPDDGAAPDDDERPSADRYTFDVYSRDDLIETAFAYHRERGFPYRSLPLHECMFEINRLAGLPEQTLMRTTIGYATADTYHPQRYAARVGEQRNALDTFADDRLLHVALGHIVDYGLPWTSHSVANLCSLTHGAQAASNFRPGAALHLLHRYAPADAVVLDTSAGYGGRLVGFLASGCSHYVGIDPASETHAGNERLARELCPDAKRVELHQLPAEDVPHELLAGRCDVALTSPPYFAKERYVDEPTQSYARYPKAEDWRDGFLRPMLELQHVALRRDAISVLNVADVKLGKEFVPLVEWSLQLARDVGFEVVAVDELPLTRRWGPQTNEVATEPLIVMRKADG